MKLCSECFNDLELKHFIISNSEEAGNCVYCNSTNTALIEVTEILDSLNDLFSLFIECDFGKLLPQVIREDWDLFSKQVDTTNLIDELLLLCGSNLRSQSLICYKPEIEDCFSYWGILKEDLKWKSRYLINTEKLEELKWNEILGYNLSNFSDGEFFRARLHKTGNNPAFEMINMGPPSREKAIAGRANPMGIPYLYLSLNLETTLYEIRASFLDEISVGVFRPKQHIELKLIDFTENISAFSGSPFNLRDIAKSKLLKRAISSDLAKPIRRYDSELEYIPTQFICEYIKYLYDIDGIIFNSSLHIGGKNLVLFNTEKVECIRVVKHQIEGIEIHSISI